MLGLSYERLEKIMKTQKPYRGSINRYPIGNRRHNLKNFYVRDENGKTVFDITCSTHYESSEITKEEYDLMKESKQSGYRVNEYTDADGKTSYSKHSFPPYFLGTVYPEEYFQFTAENRAYYSYGQGERAFLSGCTAGFFSRETRRGGMVWKHGRNIVPIFHNLRVSTKNALLQPLDDYVVVGKKVNRKIGKDILAGYESFHKTAEVMCKSIDSSVFLAMAKEVLEEHEDEKYFDVAEEIKDKAPLDAMILYTVALGVGDIRWRVQHPNWHSGIDPHTVYENLARALNTSIYKAHPEVFIPVRYGKDEAYPPSIWGYDIEVNGQIVRQY